MCVVHLRMTAAAREHACNPVSTSFVAQPQNANAVPTVHSCGGKPRFASPAWLRVLDLALLCLSLSPVRSCLLQAGGVWGGRGRRSGGGILTARHFD